MRLPSRPLLTAAVLSLALVGAYAVFVSPPEAAAQAAGSAGPVTGERARRLVGEGALLLDVRTPEEFAAGHLTGATLLPLQALEAGTRPDTPKDRPIVVYCRSGRRSAIAARILREAGVKQVHDLGGLSDGSGAFGVVTPAPAP